MKDRKAERGKYGVDEEREREREREINLCNRVGQAFPSIIYFCLAAKVSDR